MNEQPSKDQQQTMEKGKEILIKTNERIKNPTQRHMKSKEKQVKINEH